MGTIRLYDKDNLRHISTRSTGNTYYAQQIILGQNLKLDS